METAFYTHRGIPFEVLQIGELPMLQYISDVREQLGGQNTIDCIVEVALGATQSMDLALIASHGVIAGYSSDLEQLPSLQFLDFLALAGTLRAS
jgi:hypothetical protein